MVATRTQTGTISRLHYDLATLRLATSPPMSPITARAAKHSPKEARKARSTAAGAAKRSPRITKKSLQPRGPGRKNPNPNPNSKPDPNPNPNPNPKPTGAASSLGLNPQDADAGAQAVLGRLPLPLQMVDVCEGISFFPARAWGEEEEVGLSAIGRAERDVEIWEEVKRAHAAGGLVNMVPAIEAAVEGARETVTRLRREEGEGRVELGRARAENPGQVAIEERLEVLQWALDSSQFGPEKENISGAIAAYTSGAIPFSKHYTLLYAGKVVDTAPAYGAFVSDRQDRLDRYAAAHGPHWLWYEAPLDVHPESKPKMLGSLALHRAEDYTNLGGWHITQGFWKRAGWVMRMAGATRNAPSAFEPYFQRQADGSVFCQDAGPKQAFRSILDSGATYPSLYQADFQKLMIDESNYAAQSVETLSTPNGNMNSRLFELFVCVVGNDQKQLVDENHCAHPYHAKYLGGLMPVAEVQTVLKYDVFGREISTRLSGLLPFIACYLASAPTRNTLYLGEDRKDVLGSHRMPGHRKWDIALPTALPAGFDETAAKYGDPKTTFSHRGAKIVDEDDPNMDFASTVTFMKGTPGEYTQRNCPKEEMQATREVQRLAVQAEVQKLTALARAHNNPPDVLAALMRLEQEIAASRGLPGPGTGPGTGPEAGPSNPGGSGGQGK